MSDEFVMLPVDTDDLEWDADNAGGDESLYDGEAVSFIDYDPSLFDEETEEEVIDLD